MRKGGREKKLSPASPTLNIQKFCHILSCLLGRRGCTFVPCITLPISKIDIIYQGKTSQTGTLCISEYPNKQFNSDIYLNKIKLSILNKY